MGAEGPRTLRVHERLTNALASAKLSHQGRRSSLTQSQGRMILEAAFLGGTMKRTFRAPSKLSESVHHQLKMYALAAGAAGVSAIALAPPA
jgi:hypothetical protein